MKKFTILLLVMALAYPLGWGFAQEKTISWKEHLTLARSHAIAQISLREEKIQRLQDQIDVWKNQLQTIDAELMKIKQAEKPKKEKEPVKK